MWPDGVRSLRTRHTTESCWRVPRCDVSRRDGAAASGSTSGQQRDNERANGRTLRPAQGAPGMGCGTRNPLSTALRPSPCCDHDLAPPRRIDARSGATAHGPHGPDTLATAGCRWKVRRRSGAAPGSPTVRPGTIDSRAQGPRSMGNFLQDREVSLLVGGGSELSTGRRRGRRSPCESGRIALDFGPFRSTPKATARATRGRR